MKKIFLLLLMLACLFLYGCNKDTPNKNTPENPPAQPDTQVSSNTEVSGKPEFTKETYPKTDGSTATIPLSEAIASNLLKLSKDDASKFIKHNTTHEAYVNLIKGTADLILVTEPSKEELNLAKEANVELEIFPIVKEGFVFLANTNNPVNSLTTKQIQAIYQGKINNWKDLGGENKEIIAYQREPNSGSQTLMEQLVMKGLSMTKYPSTVVYGMDGLIERIAKYDNSEKALGYSVFYYAKTMYNKDTVKLLSVDGIAPNNKNIASGKYPFTTAYYAVLKKNTPSDAPSRRLLNWLLGKEGQKLAEETGYVQLETEPSSVQNIKLLEKPNKTRYLLTNGIKINYPNKIINTEKGENSIMLPQIEGLSDKALEEKINKTIEKDIENQIKLYISEYTGEFIYAGVTVDFNANNLLGISIRGYYTPPVYGFLYRLTDGKRLDLKDIFTEGTDYVSLLNRKVTEGILKGETLEENILKEPFKTIESNQNFALSPSTLYVVFHKGEGGFNQRSSVAVPLSAIDDYVDVMDRYSGTERKTQLYSDLFVRTNNIFLTYKGEVYKRDIGNLWLYYPEVSGLRNTALEKKINTTIKASIDELKDSSLFNNLPKGDAYGKECTAIIELTATFNHYGILSIERNVNTFTSESLFDNLHKVYCFDLINSKDIDSKVLLTNYLSKNSALQQVFVNRVRAELKQQCLSRRLDFKDIPDYNIDYSYIDKNGTINFSKYWDGDEIYIHVSFMLNKADGTPCRADCAVPLKAIHQGAPEDFFGW